MKFLKKEFKIMIPKKLSEMQENTNKQYKEMRKTIHNMNEKIIKDKTHTQRLIRILSAKSVNKIKKYNSELLQ
jgi:hypothetical protein